MFLRYNLPAILWAVVIFILCAIPGDDLPTTPFFNIPHFDKMVHAFLYAVLEYLLMFGFTKQYYSNKILKCALGMSLILNISYGAVIEILQGTIFIERSTDIFDIMANASGAFFGLFIFKLRPFHR